MSTPLHGKVAIVTGAGRGIGRALSLGLADAGASVVAVARSEDQVVALADEIVRAGGRSIGISADIADPGAVDEAIAAALDSLGQIDVLVNNAGILRSGKAAAMAVDDFRAVMETNVTGTYTMTRSVLPHMIQRGGGKVINIASSWGIKPVPNHVAYCASKAAILHMTRVMAVELASSDIQVNAVAPGYVRTEMNAEALDDPDVGPRILGRIPAGRVAVTDELVPLVTFLASGASDYITGEVITIDGGFHVK